MTITEFIKSNPKLSEMDYIIVFTTITELIGCGKLKWEGHNIV